MTQKLSRHLMLGALALLWLPAVAFGWNAVSKQQWQSRPLDGAQKMADPPALTLGHLIDGSFQRSVAQRVSPSIPFYINAVRWHNQILYTAFNFSTSPHILIGKDDHLLNPLYARIYCQRDIKNSENKFESWARILREIQDKVESRGQIFLYVLTPSKMDYFPEMLPSGFPCPSPDRDRFIAAALPHLDREGVKYVDATSNMDRIRPTYGYDPFTPRGYHWTGLGSYPATLEIMRAINRDKGQKVLQPYEIAVEEAQSVLPWDQDYAYLLNVVGLPAHESTARILVRTPPPAECPEPISILTVGGSFFFTIGINLSLAPCPAKIDQFFYFIHDTYVFKDGKNISTGKNPDYSAMASYDVIIVEENADILVDARHIPAFYDYLHAKKLPAGTVY